MPDDMEKMLAEIQERCDKATPGEWCVQENINAVCIYSPQLAGDKRQTTVCQFLRASVSARARLPFDPPFIAHARTDVPNLLAWGKVMQEALQKCANGEALSAREARQALSLAEKALRGESG